MLGAISKLLFVNIENNDFLTSRLSSTSQSRHCEGVINFFKSNFKTSIK